MIRLLRTVVLLALLVGLGAKANEPGLDDTEHGRPAVYTVNYPLAWMARELAAGQAQVHFPAPVDIDPAYWEPDVEVILAYQQADLVLLNGAGYARWIRKASLPLATQRDTSRSYTDSFIEVEGGPTHSHGPEGEHSHGERAFTTWLDFDLAGQQLQAVAAALDALLGEGAAERGERQSQLAHALNDLDERMVAIGQTLQGAPILYSHPVYQYLQRRYGLNGKALHWEPGEMPAEQQWSALEQLLAHHPARLMLWEGEPLPEVAAKLEQMGVAVVLFAPVGNRPEVGDFLSVMKANISALQKALADQGKG